MTSLDYIKLVGIVPIFFILGPLLGIMIKGQPGKQRVVFAIMCFMTINGLFGPGNWGLTLASIETYRGHTKGYHFYFNHALAIGLIVAKWLEDPKSFRWVPPGLGLYLLYCALSLLSIINAPDKNYVLMAAHKSIFVSLIMLATYNTLRNDQDLQFFLRVMAVTITWELFICIKSKYADGIYQVRGTFEHQNPLAMYSVLLGMMFMVTGLGPAFPWSNYMMFAFIVCGVIVEFTLSRGALVMFGVGAVGCVLASLADKITKRRVMVTSILGILGGIGLMLAIDTIISRFKDKGNVASGELREVMKNACRAMVHDHPLGIGWNNYALVVNPPYPYAEIYYDWLRGKGQIPDEDAANAVVESHYYLLLSETGYTGLNSWLLVIFVGLYRNLRAAWFFGHSFRRCLSLGIFIGCALNYEQSTLERVLVQPRNLMMWMIVMGVTARLEVMRREAKAAAKAAQTLPAATTVAA